MKTTTIPLLMMINAAKRFESYRHWSRCDVEAERDSALCVGRMAGGFKKILVLVCGFCADISFYLVIEMDLYI